MQRNSMLTWLGAAALGAGAMYFLDPRSGGRRRALVRDQGVHAQRRMREMADKTANDVRNRAVGLAARSRRLWQREPVSDPQLAERVRAMLGRVVSHPSALEVTVTDGVVRLSGPILEHEVERLVRAVGKVRGVEGVEDHLELHLAADIPALQGGSERTGDLPDLLQRRWSPTTRLLLATAGATLAVAGGARRDRLGALLGGLGLTMLGSGLSPIEPTRLLRRRDLEAEPWAPEHLAPETRREPSFSPGGLAH
jgi:osmotically-inducible protein OsmY